MLLLLHIVFSIGSIVWMIAGRLGLWISLFHRFFGASTFVYRARASRAVAFHVPRPPLIWIAFTSIEATKSPVLVFGFEQGSGAFGVGSTPGSSAESIACIDWTVWFLASWFDNSCKYWDATWLLRSFLFSETCIMYISFKCNKSRLWISAYRIYQNAPDRLPVDACLPLRIRCRCLPTRLIGDPQSTTKRAPLSYTIPTIHPPNHERREKVTREFAGHPG